MKIYGRPSLSLKALISWLCGLWLCSCPLSHAARPYETTLFWSHAADFLIRENDIVGLQKFEDKVLKERPSESVLIDQLLDFHLHQKDRDALQRLFSRLTEALRCHRATASKNNFRELCARWSHLWVGNLDSVLFFEESAHKLEKSRRLILDKDCASALGVLEDLRIKEASAKPVLQWMSRAYDCLGDVASKTRVEGQLKEMRIFASDS